jgi:hypothetical protein
MCCLLFCHPNMVCCTRVFAVELCHLQLCIYLCMHLPLIVTFIIDLPLDQVLQAVVMHSAVQYSLDLILFLTINKSWGWGWCRLSARDGIRMHKGQLDHREDWVEAAEVGGGRARQYAPCVRGHPSISLLPLSSPTLLLLICIYPPHLCTILKDYNHSRRLLGPMVQ